MHGKHTKPMAFHQRVLARMGPIFLTFMVTLLALPVNAAITLPTEPLTTNSRIPPNILFILDDSGSMAFDEMENPLVQTICRRNSGGGCISGSTITDYTYVGNTVYYNPALPYLPWVNAAGSPLTGGTDYNAAYASFNHASDPIDLGNSGSCASVDRNGSSTNVCGGTQTFYVPKNTASTDATYLRDALNYYRYQILTNGTIERSEWGAVATSAATAVAVTPAAGTVNNSSATHALASVSAGVVLEVVITSTNNRSKNYELRNPGGSVVCSGSVDDTNSRTCTVNPTVSGNYSVVMSRNNNNNATYSLSASYYTDNRCAGATGASTWINCANMVPSTRSEADERTNYATWFSYHRTRMKTAKAGSSRAFSDLGNNVRVGFRTIWRRGQQTGTNRLTHTYPIPVNENYGLFSDPNGAGGANNNRTEWYRRLFDARGQSGTPLHGALDGAGQYFSSNSSTGPYGPESGTDQYSCRQNFAILTTDGYWNDYSNYTTGSSGNQDGSAGTAITGPGGTPSYTYAATAPYSDTQPDTLADVAMRYWKSDLRTDLDNIVPTSAANNAFWQHMVTFGISIGLKGNTGFTSVSSVPSNYASWPNPNDSENADRIDDLLHAAVNGHGSFLSAGNPTEFATGLKSALATITERTSSFSNVAANSTRLDTNTRVFQAKYEAGTWVGELTAYGVTYSGTPSLPSVDATPSWQASQGIPTTGRDIFTYDGTAGAVFPTAAQTIALNRVAAPAVSGADNAAYIKGDTSRELSNAATGVPGLRNRKHLLGDIVTSSPAFVSDTDTIYVGANDGMLHAFNAVDGAELFAYVPAGISMSALSTLSRPDYAHRYFVDGPTVVSSRKQTPGENILVGALGKGGKGIYALDVTDPANFTAASVKWENTSGANMGLVQSKPIIAKLNNGDMGAIVSNGINSTNGRAVLFVYNLRTGALLSEIDTGVGSPVTDDPNSNGLSAPVGWDADGNGTLDYVYAGDMLGNVWKFNLSSTTSTAWDAGSNRTLLFTATYPGTPSQVQPITGGLTVALDPVTFKTWVLFGTGRFMTPGDVTSSNVQSVYGLIDEGANISRGDLQQRSIIVAGTGSSGQPVRGFQAEESLASSMKGWYIDLLTPASGGGTAEGERVVSDAQIVGDVLVFASIIPESNACQPDGRGYINALDAFTGTSTGPSFFDLDRDGKFDDETLADGGGTVPVGSIDLGVGMPTLPNVLRGLAVVGGSGGGTGGVPIRESRNVNRVSWREVIRD